MYLSCRITCITHIKRNGYWYIKKRNHPFSDKQGYIAEHRLVMEKFLNRYLLHIEIIHHKNGIRTDNRIENLEVFTSPGKHLQHHRPDLKEKQRILFKGKHFSLETEFKKGDPKLIGNQWGFRKGKSAWNKGKLWSKKHKEKLKLSHIGKHQSNKGCFKKGQVPWNKGKKKGLVI